MRLDRWLTENGLTVSRAKAHEMILSGAVYVDGKSVTKPAFDVCDLHKIEVAENPLQRYVGRGGLKLEAALNHFRLSPKGVTAIDIGASSGGFTDCLLKAGAAKVYAVDSGEGQLHDSLRADARVVSMEKYNARYLSSADLEDIPVFGVMDVSFISQTLILPALADVMGDGGALITLVKPQFELGRAALGKGGIVKDKRKAVTAVEKVTSAAALCGFTPLGFIPSPIEGGDGNLEFLAAFRLIKGKKKGE